MRIGDFGPGNDPGQSPDRRERSAAFRRRHKPGDRVVGRVLRREAPGLSWVDFSGLALLTDIPSDPDPGDLRLFEVEDVEGHIRLRELGPACSSGAAAPDPALLAAFRRARAGFESLAGPLLDGLAGLPAPEREDALDRGVAAAPALVAARDETWAALDRLAAEFSRLGLGQPGYRPWLLPTARESELALLPPAGSLARTDFSFTVPGHGAGEVVLLCGPAAKETAGCGARLFLEHKALARPATEAALLLAPAHAQVKILGLHPLPAERRGGVLAALVAGLSGRGAHISSRV